VIPESAFYQGLFGGVLFCIVLGVAGGLLTRMSPWYYGLRQPGWKPPDWSFGPIWTIVFAFICFAIAYAWDAANAGQRSLLLTALAINGILNIAWSGVFFMMKNAKLAFAELVVFWLSIVFLILVAGSITTPAGLLMLPYLVWVTTAGVLNFQIVKLNPT
jgi:translocator protein